MGRILAPIEAEVLKKCAAARKAAVVQPAKEIKEDFKKRVFDQAVLDYYSDYQPSIYRRSESLYDTFKVYSKASQGRYVSIEYDWDFNRLPQYVSRSPRHQSGNEWVSRDDPNFDPDSDDNGIPEKGWVFENFMEGIHPRWFFMKDIGLVNDSAYFTPSWERIKRYKDDYINNGYAKDILIKNLQKQYHKL